MKHCFQSILFFLLIFLLHCPAKAQDFDNFSREMIYDTLWSHGNFDFNKPLKDQLLPLDTILIIAIENHPKMKFEEALIERSEYNLKNTKRLWMNNLYGTVGYNGGNQSIILNNSETSDESSNLTNGYRWGINLRLPLYELMGRPAQVKMMNAELDASQRQYEARALDLQKTVIQAYFDLLNAQELVESRGADMETQASNLEMAQIEMIQGNLEMDTYARIYNMSTNTKAIYLEAKQRFYTAFYAFETIVGVDINLLKR
ncbi:MAG: hypothetical protein CL843_12930 [Crocinitomicaceae bacterium]|nr:hypothetical protein [Crocinitomicaceae bacterium]|tara:strand:+ start:650 stop:1426 length:777 start_codon:yes stop_codon:yes gene_type:complete